MKWKNELWIVSFAFLGLLFIPSESQAIPAWARKYGVSCGACHSPDIPRLNVTGHQFRKLGFRMPEELGEMPKYKEIGEYISMRGRARYEYEKYAKGRTAATSRFKWTDATLFYGGAVTQNLSAFFEWEWADVDEIDLLGQFSWLIGKPERYVNFRLGQMHTLTREGWAGFDRPTGISTPDALSTDITTGGTGFKFSTSQRGVEAAIGVTKNARIITEVLNGLNQAGKGTSGTQEGDTDKDFLLAYEQILTEKGSGFTLVGYRGTWHNASGADDTTQFDFYRLGAAGSLVFATPFNEKLDSEIQGGVLSAHDVNPLNSRGSGRDIDGLGGWLGLEQRFDRASIFARWDTVDPNTAVNNDLRQKYTLGNTYHINDSLRWANEGFVKSDDNGTDSAGVTTELLFIF